MYEDFIGNARKDRQEMHLLVFFSEFLQEKKTDIAKNHKMY